MCSSRLFKIDCSTAKSYRGVNFLAACLLTTSKPSTIVIHPCCQVQKLEVRTDIFGKSCTYNHKPFEFGA